MEKPSSFKQLLALARGYDFDRWREPRQGYGDAGGKYMEVNDSKGETVIGEWGFNEEFADYAFAASPAVIKEADEFMNAQAARIAELEARLKQQNVFNAPSALVSDFQEFIYRVVAQVPFDQAEWANQKAQALMAALKSAQDESSK